MYCSNCGKKVYKKDRFCANCGNEIIRHSDDVKKKTGTPKDIQEELSMKWFDFYRIFVLGITLIVGIINILPYLDFRNRNTIVWDEVLIGMIFLTVILNIIIPLILMLGLPQKSKNTYMILIGSLIVDYIYRVVFTSLNTYNQYKNENLLIYILISIFLFGIWYIPNIVYFTKRKNLFK